MKIPQKVYDMRLFTDRTKYANDLRLQRRRLKRIQKIARSKAVGSEVANSLRYAQTSQPKLTGLQIRGFRIWGSRSISTARRAMTRLFQPVSHFGQRQEWRATRDYHVRNGMTPADARKAATRDISNGSLL